MKNIILYHANCSDGSAAAMAAWLKFGEKAKYIPVQYNNPLPEIESGSNVHILDFSYPRDILIELHNRSSNLIVLDHHKTAMAALKDLPFATFDLEKSGARLAWEYFHPDRDVPELITLVEDRDLWRFKFEDTKPVAAALALEKDFKSFAPYVENCAPLIPRGKYKLEFDRVAIDSAVKKAIATHWFGYTCVIINIGDLISDVGANFYSKYDIDFAVMYFITKEGEFVFSLRSNRVDVSQIALQFGGGGHAGAAGGKLSMAQGARLLELLYANSFKLEDLRIKT